MRNRVIIFTNGNLSDFSQVKKIIKKTDFIIAADGGANHLEKLELKPNVVIGDMDSIDKKLLKKYKSIKYPRKKDKTDFELAINYCLEKKFKEIIIFGILGDRIDHLLANIFLIARTQNTLLRPDYAKATSGKQGFGGQVKIIEGKKEIFILNKEIMIHGKIGDEISIIPVSEKLEGVTTEGLYYRLINNTLTFGSTRGVSNIMNKNVAKIILKKGVALVELNHT